MLHQARDLAAHPEVAQAAAAGRISVGQARAIGTVLGGLESLTEDQQAKAEALLLAMAASMDADRLAKAAPQVLLQVAPAQADEATGTSGRSGSPTTGYQKPSRHDDATPTEDPSATPDTTSARTPEAREAVHQSNSQAELALLAEREETRGCSTKAARNFGGGREAYRGVDFTVPASRVAIQP